MLKVSTLQIHHLLQLHDKISNQNNIQFWDKGAFIKTLEWHNVEPDVQVTQQYRYCGYTLALENTTRGWLIMSALALWQTNWCCIHVQEIFPQLINPFDKCHSIEARKHLVVTPHCDTWLFLTNRSAFCNLLKLIHGNSHVLHITIRFL